MNKTAKKPDPFTKVEKNPDNYAVYSGNLMLKTHDNDSASFWLDGLYEVNPFQAGNESPERPNNGTRYVGLFVEINDDEMPVDQEIKAKLSAAVKQRFKQDSAGDKVVKQAAIMCGDRQFQRFVYSRIKRFDDQQVSVFLFKSGIPGWLLEQKIESMSEPDNAKEWCKYYMYYRCGVNSRRQLGFYTEAKQKYSEMMNEFNQWGDRYAKN